MPAADEITSALSVPFPASPSRSGTQGAIPETADSWLAVALPYLQSTRADMCARANRLASGHVRLWELQDGQHADITEQVALKLQIDIATVENLLRQAGIELEGDC